MEDEKRLKREKIRKEFLAGFIAGVICFGVLALALVIIFSL